MKRATILCPRVNGTLGAMMYQQFKDCAPKEFLRDVDPRGFQLVFEPDSPQLQEAIDVLNKNHESYVLFSDTSYTKRELADVPFFWLEGTYPLELEGTSVKDYGTQYQNVCPECGFGGTPVGDILVDRKFVKRIKFAHLIPELVVSPEVKAIIEDNNLTGITFSSMVKDFKGREIPPLYVAHIHSILPPLSKSAWLKYNDYSCGHGILYLYSDLQYEKNKLGHAKDFNFTYEHLNNYRVRDVVVSAKVRNLFNSCGVRLRFKPVTVLDD